MEVVHAIYFISIHCCWLDVFFALSLGSCLSSKVVHPRVFAVSATTRLCGLAFLLGTLFWGLIRVSPILIPKTI
ncbi:hypothetical protein B0H19DRAFT_1130496 [Mycena capillaripes]|nr:hypothetical protein B0H19DRAFT_1130496 [Mycena capillaripes]